MEKCGFCLSYTFSDTVCIGDDDVDVDKQEVVENKRWIYAKQSISFVANVVGIGVQRTPVRSSRIENSFSFSKAHGAPAFGIAFQLY